MPVRKKRLTLVMDNNDAPEPTPRPKRDEWLKSCYKQRPNKAGLWLIANTDETSVALYITKDASRPGVEDDNHIYHLWVEDEEKYSGKSERTAYAMYHQVMREYKDANK